VDVVPQHAFDALSRACAACVPVGTLAAGKPGLFMNSVVPAASRVSLSRFLLGWLVSWILPAMASTGLVGMFDNLRIGGFSQWLFQFSLMSFPASWALGQGYLMRESLRRPRLWAALTGGGVVAGVAVVVAIHMRFELASWSFRRGITMWVLDRIGLADLPAALAALGLSGVLFGLVLGALQTPALDMPRRLRIEWTIISAAAGLLPASWAYLSFELQVLDHLRDAVAAVIPLNGGWRYLPGAAIWISSMVFGFALPTGLFMHWLLRRHQRADAEALVRRFE
jgi:hypothetical protein